MLQRVLNTVSELNPEKIIVVIGKHGRDVKESVEADIKTRRRNHGVSFAYQKRGKGYCSCTLEGITVHERIQGDRSRHEWRYTSHFS